MFNPTQYYGNQWDEHHHQIFPEDYAYSENFYEDFGRNPIPPYQPHPPTYPTKQKRGIARRKSYQEGKLIFDIRTLQ